MSGPPYDAARLRQIAGEIVSTGRELAARRWTPATSGNFSMRLDETHAAITVSGLDKGRLTEDGVMVVDLDGRPASGGPARRRSARSASASSSGRHASRSRPGPRRSW